MEQKKTGKLTNLINKLTKAAQKSKSRGAELNKKDSNSSEKWEETFSKIMTNQIIPQ